MKQTLIAWLARLEAQAPSAPPRQVAMQVVYYDMISGEEEQGERYTYEIPADVHTRRSGR